MSQKAQSSGVSGLPPLSEARIVAYLRENPDFLTRHPELLSVIESPQRAFAESDENGGEVVDLQHAMLAQMRRQLEERAGQCSELIDAGRSNLQSQSRIHTTVLALLGARSLEHFLEILTTDLTGLLDVDAAALCLETGTVAPATSHGIRILPEGTIAAIVESERAVTLRENISGDRRLFGEASGLVRSDALLRLDVREGGPAALLALGSREVRRFHPGQGTELLGFLARIMSHCIRTWLDLPR